MQRRQGDRRVAERRDPERRTGTPAETRDMRPKYVAPTPVAFEEPRTSEHPAERVREERPAPAGGPSFLGLEDAPSYLLEDEETHGERSYGRFIMLLVLLAAVGAVAFNWQRIREAATAARDNSVLNGGAPAAAAPNHNNLPVTGAQAPTPPADNIQPPGTAPANATPDPAGSNSDEPPAAPPKKAHTAAVPKSAASKDAEADPPTRAEPEERRVSEKTTAEPEAKRNSAVGAADKFLYGDARQCGRAIEILNQAAGRGDFEAQTKLGVLYATGTCVPFNRVRAYHWYTVASRSSDSPWLEQSKNMLWSQMSEAERKQVAGR